jgi:S-adenosylmethionine synthetase
MSSHKRFYDEREFLFTSESVSEGHPDKVADQISDAILDEYLGQNPYARVAIETLVTTNQVVVAGEIKGVDKNDKKIEEVVRNQIKKIGYAGAGFDWQTAKIDNYIHGQSAHIAMGVDNSNPELEGAGDQGLMFGYACDETPDLMPAAIYYSHKILRNIFAAIKSGELKGLGPDAKSQVTLKYKGTEAVGIYSLVVSIQHVEGYNQKQVRDLIYPYVRASLPAEWAIPEDKFYVNPTGLFIIGGPDGDTGLTGRKIIVDSYGGAAPHGGGAFSGKDPTKVDRSAAYMARYLAKNIVAAKIASACTLQIAYAIGVAKPVGFYINTHGTGTVNEYELAELITKTVDLSPYGIRTHLQLNRPIYLPTATYGHFGRTPDIDGAFPWEKLDLVDKLK